MRYSTDTCLLCKTNASEKTNSHILPKFLTSKLFGNKQSKRGYQVPSDHNIDKQPQVIQDSPKEDYILCPDCESYFSVLETYCAKTFLEWRTKVKSGDFKIHSFPNLFSIVEYSSSNKLALRLLIYSIFWRSSVSQHTMFKIFKLDENTEEIVRSDLLTYKSLNKVDLERILNSISLRNLFPFTIITAESFTNETENLIFAPPFKNCYSLYVDQFNLLLFEKEEDISVQLFQKGSNIKINDGQIIVFTSNNWKEFVVKPVIDGLAEAIDKNTN